MAATERKTNGRDYKQRQPQTLSGGCGSLHLTIHSANAPESEGRNNGRTRQDNRHSTEHIKAGRGHQRLYCKVLERYGRKLGVDFTRVSVDSFFRSYKKYNIPSVETVGRCRRKLQEEYPELRGSETTEAQRGAREKQFRHYARN